MPPIQFATQSYQSKSLPISAQRLVNMYAEREPPDAKTPVALYGCPGLASFANSGTGPIRGTHVLAGVLYAVSGNALYKIDASGTATQMGLPIIGNNNNVSMADNGIQLCIVNGTSGYIFTVAGGLVQITSPNFFPADTVTFFDDYFVFNRSGTNQFFISAILDGASFSGLDFATAEVQPGNLKAVINDHEVLLLFCEHVTETWYDSGALSFPFQRYDGGTIERGCIASQTPIKEDNSVFFLGDDLIFYRLVYNTPQRVSTHAIESAWQKYGVVTDAFTFSYTFGGHKFLTLTFPSGGGTWVYDIASGLWHERESWDANNNSLVRWRGNCSVNAYSRFFIGDAFSGNIGVLDDNTFTEYGNTIRAQATSPPIFQDRNRLFMSRFEMDIDSGVGLTVGQGSNPQIMLDWSDDGGRTWSQQQQWSSMGQLGAYQTRLRWLRMGQFRNRILRAQISDPVKRTIIRAHADIKPGLG